MVRLVRDGKAWRIGTDADLAYATAMVPSETERQETHDQAVLSVLREQSPDQPWWLGYLDTGADDIVFPDAPMFWNGVLPNVMFPAS
jgi:hypothetical protein